MHIRPSGMLQEFRASISRAMECKPAGGFSHLSDERSRFHIFTGECRSSKMIVDDGCESALQSQHHPSDGRNHRNLGVFSTQSQVKPNFHRMDAALQPRIEEMRSDYNVSSGSGAWRNVSSLRRLNDKRIANELQNITRGLYNLEDICSWVLSTP